MDLSTQSVLPMFGVAVTGSLVIAVVFLYPLWRSLSRAGFYPAWSLIILIPFLWPATIVAVFGILAFGQWPSLVGPTEKTSWRALSRTSWTSISPEEAFKNRHYGFDGWVLAFYGLVVLSTFMSIVNAFELTNTILIVQNFYGVTPGEAKLNQGLLIAWSVVLLILVPVKSRLVPFILIAGAWIYMFLFAAIFLTLGVASYLTIAPIVSGLLFTPVFSWYWLKSKRVNVTYRHRIPAGQFADTKFVGGA